MTADLIFALSLSILFPFLIGIIRIRTIRARFGIMLCLLGAGLLAELLYRYAIITDAINWVKVNNLYILVESLLIPLQFYAWGYLRRNKWLFYALLLTLLVGWIVMHLVVGNIGHLQPHYRMFYSLVIVLLSINSINYLVVHDEKRLVAEPVFIFCCGFIIFFTYQLVYEGIYSMVRNLEDLDTAKLNNAFSIINCICNLLYGIALLLVPSNVIRNWFDKKTTG